MDDEYSSHLKSTTPYLLFKAEKEAKSSLPNILKAINPSPNRNNLFKLRLSKLRPVLEGRGDISTSARTNTNRISMPSLETKRSTSHLFEDSTPKKKNSCNPIAKVFHRRINTRFCHQSTIVDNTSEIAGYSILQNGDNNITQSPLANAPVLRTSRTSSIPLKKGALSFEDKKKSVEMSPRKARYIVNTKLIEAEIRETLISYETVSKTQSQKPTIYTGRRKSLIKLNDAKVLRTSSNVNNDYTGLSKRLMTKYVHESAKQFVLHNNGETPKFEKSEGSSSPRKRSRKKNSSRRKLKQKGSVDKDQYNSVVSAPPGNITEEESKKKKKVVRRIPFKLESCCSEQPSLGLEIKRKHRTPRLTREGSLDEINEKIPKEEILYDIGIFEKKEIEIEANDVRQQQSVKSSPRFGGDGGGGRQILLSYVNDVGGVENHKQMFGNKLLTFVHTEERKMISEETLEQSEFHHKGLSPLIQDLIL